MTPAELKTIRESLGLSMQWCATHVGRVKNVRSWQFWEVGGRSIPADVKARMLELDATAAEIACQGATQAQVVRALHGAPEIVELYRYATDAELWSKFPDMRPLPTTYHAAILSKTRRLLLDHGFAVVVDYA
jgi:superfamily I DNA and RNA helicase